MIFRLELLLVTVEYPSDNEGTFQSALVHTDGQDQLKSTSALRRCVVVQQTVQTGQQATSSQPDARPMPFLVLGGFSRHLYVQRSQNVSEEDRTQTPQCSTTGMNDWLLRAEMRQREYSGITK